VVEDNQA
jgi:hypothetical protein